jgi:lipopolysaccharide/colanic/teichoic acid biosynthesis glycosyltransferase
MTAAHQTTKRATAAAAATTGGYEAAKRATDVALATAALVVAAPVAAAIAWRIRREDGGPVIFPGLRVGRGGSTFPMFKFRTMIPGAERSGVYQTANDDPRLTSTGRFLRRWKLDELPQLVNVLRGDMSLVGPRPPVERDAARYTPEQRQLFEIRPGITDWASIRYRDLGTILAGWPDPHAAYEALVRPRKMELALAYRRCRSYGADLRILGLTGLALLRYRRVDEILERVVASTRTHA